MRALLLIFFLVFNSTIFSQEKNQVVLQTFDKIIEIMVQNYFDQNYQNLPWEQLTTETRRKIQDATTIEEAYEKITEQLKKLGHSHLEFHPPYQTSKKVSFKNYLAGDNAKNLPFRFMLHQNSLLVTYVEESSKAYQAGLRAGVLIQKIGEDTTEEIIKKDKVHSSIYNTLMHLREDSLSLSGVDAKNQAFTCSFELLPYTGKFSSFGNIQNYPLDFKYEILEDNIAYIRINVFLFDIVKDVIDAIQQSKEKECRGVILDIRNNPGGIGMLASAIAKEFCTAFYQLGVQHTTAKNGITEIRFPVQPQANAFTNTVVILINESSASTSEVLAIGMQENKSAKIVGTKSPGLALPSLLLMLEDGSFFQYPIADFKTPKGKSLEGIGVTPDYTVVLHPAKIAQGEDEQIKKAIEVIKQGK